jgi:hypothetical protein
MDMIAFGLLASAAILTMACKSFIEPSLLALAMTHLLQLSGSMQWAVRQTAEAENHMTSVERILGYCNLPQERINATERKGGGAVSSKWPSSAQLEFEGVEVCYFCLNYASVYSGSIQLITGLFGMQDLLFCFLRRIVFTSPVVCTCFVIIPF